MAKEEQILQCLHQIREWYDKKVGKNTIDSSNGDQYANKIGRFLGSTYPKEDCDELVQRYINRHY